MTDYRKIFPEILEAMEEQRVRIPLNFIDSSYKNDEGATWIQRNGRQKLMIFPDTAMKAMDLKRFMLVETLDPPKDDRLMVHGFWELEVEINYERTTDIVSNSWKAIEKYLYVFEDWEIGDHDEAKSKEWIELIEEHELRKGE
jgi:hypothetical protein